MKNISYLLLLLIPIQFTFTTVIILLAVFGFNQGYETMKAELDGWVFDLVYYIVVSAPLVLIANLVIMILLFIGFDSNRFKSSFHLRQTKEADRQ